MEVEMVKLLRCPTCHVGELQLGEHILKDGEVFEGLLTCASCLCKYQVREFIAILTSRQFMEQQTGRPEGSSEHNRDEIDAKLKQMKYYDEHPLAYGGLSDWTYGIGWSLRAPRTDGDTYTFLLNKMMKDLAKAGLTFNNKRILDVAGGTGRLSRHFATIFGAKPTVLDISFSNLKMAARLFEDLQLPRNVILGDAETLPFIDEAFDIAMEDSSLHHLPNPNKAIAELWRISREGFFFCEGTESILVKLGSMTGLTNPDRHEAAGNEAIAFHKSSIRSLVQSLGVADVTFTKKFLVASHRVRFGRKRILTKYLESEFVLNLVNGIFGPLGNKLLTIVVKNKAGLTNECSVNKGQKV